MSNTGIYYIDGSVVAESGNVVVYNMDDCFYLEIGPGHNLWTIESELPDYIDQLGDTLFGDVLEIGLGLGVASRVILSCEKVKSLTTVEKNRDVIKCYNKVKNILDDKLYKLDILSDKKHKIINKEGLRYINSTQKKYDFIFIDCYTVIDEDTLLEIEQLVIAGKRILKPGGSISAWYDKYTLDEHTEKFNEIFGSNYVSS